MSTSSNKGILSFWQKIDVRRHFAFDARWFEDAFADISEQDLIDDLERRRQSDRFHDR